MGPTAQKRSYVAIDYDRRDLRLVVFDCTRRHMLIHALHTVPIKPEVDVSDAASLGRFLGVVVSRLGLRGAKALMCVGRTQAVLKSLALPPSAETGELASMVQFQMSKELPFSVAEAVVDFTPGPHWDTDQTQADAAEGTTVLAAAVRLPVLDAAQQICTEAGLKLQRLGLRPYANLRAVYRCVRCRLGERLLLVNLTADEAEIDVMCDETLEFSRAATVYLPDPQGESTDGKAPERERAESVRRVIAEITRSLQSFDAVQRGAQIHACLVAGATGLEKDLAQSLSGPLSVKCQLFDPSGGFGVTSEEGIGGFGAALGLAAGQAAEDLPFDFLNPKRPVERRDTRRVRAAAIVAAAVVLLTGGALAGRSYLGGRQDALRALEKKSKQLKKDAANLRKLQKCAHAVDTWLESTPGWLDHLRRVSDALPPTEELYLTSFQCSGAKIALVGRAKSRDVALRFAKKLMAVPGYEVRDKGSNPVRDKLGYGQEFRFELFISLKAPPAGGRAPATAPATAPAPNGKRR